MTQAARLTPERLTPSAPKHTSLRQLAPPKPLAVLLAIVVIVGLAWALLVAPWQSPDETTHFAYAQSLAENFELPGVPGRPGYSSDQGFADAAAGASRGAFWPQAVPPDWSSADYDAYLTAEHGSHPPSRSDGSGTLPTQNPPLYYLFADIGYLIDHGGTAFGRLYTMRISGVLLLVLTTIGAWLLAGETLGRRRLPQLACAAFAGLLPMSTFVSTAVNPDALLITTWTLALWLGARVINRGAHARDAIGLCAITAAAIVTKSTSYALIVPALFALLVGWRRRPASERRWALRNIAVAAVVLALPVLAWLVIARLTGRAAISQVATSAAHPFRVGQFLSYLWQYYLPRLPFMSPFRITPQVPLYDIWLYQGTGVFGWLDIYLPHWLYPAAAWIAGGISIATLALLTRVRGSRQLALLGFLALAALALLGLLHLTDYRSLIAGSGQFMQGRYLLPAIGIGGLAVGLIVGAVPWRARPVACGVVITGLLAFQVVALSTVLRGYYL